MNKVSYRHFGGDAPKTNCTQDQVGRCVDSSCEPYKRAAPGPLQAYLALGTSVLCQHFRVSSGYHPNNQSRCFLAALPAA